MLEYLLYLVVAYLIGSVPFGYLAGRINGIDLREHGSRNIGATNAVRVLGKRWGIPVFVCDFLKGFLPLLWLKVQFGGSVADCSTEQVVWLLLVMDALIFGHTFTCFLRFRGGKGVATAAGCLMALSPTMGGVALLTWVLCMLLTRYVSLSSMVAGLAMLVASVVEFLVLPDRLSVANVLVPAMMLLIFLLVVFKHRANIVRLCNGTEPRAFSGKKS